MGLQPERMIILQAMFYDPLVWLLGLGEAGGGADGLAVAARAAAGPTSRVVGMDSSVAMLARARRRSDRAHAPIEA